MQKKALSVNISLYIKRISFILHCKPLPDMKFIFRLHSVLVFLALSSSLFGQMKSNITTIAVNESKQFFITSTSDSEGSSVPTVVLAPAHGQISAIVDQGDNNYEFTYIPNADFVGFDEFTIEYSKSISSFATSKAYTTYKLQIEPSILTPNNDYAIIYLGGSTTVDVLQNDEATTSLSLTNIPFAEGGSASIVDNKINFQSNGEFAGLAHLKYTVCDNLGNCKIGSFTVSVLTQVPSSSELSLATTSNAVVISPLEWDTYQISVFAQNGTASIVNNQEFRYTPNNGFTGKDSIFLTSTIGGTDITKKILIDVYPSLIPNSLAIEDFVFTQPDVPVTFNVLDNDYGLYSDIDFTQPFNGEVVYNGNGEFQFTPPTGYKGGQFFTYQLKNTLGSTVETGVVSIATGSYLPKHGTYKLTATQNTPLLLKYPIPFDNCQFEIINQADHGTVSFVEGPEPVILMGETVMLHHALIYFPDPGYIGDDEFGVRYYQLDSTKEVKISMTIIEAEETCIDDCIWPGDTNADGVVNSKDLEAIGLYFGLQGPTRPNNSTDWFAHQAGDDWNYPYSATNLKHVDTNGDGQINSDDVAVIEESFAKFSRITPRIFSTHKNLDLKFDYSEYEGTISYPGDFISLPISLGTATQPVTGIYSLAYSIHYNADLMDSSTVTFQYDHDSWLTQNDAVLTLNNAPIDGDFESGLTRTGKLATSGHGIIGSFDFIIEDEIIWKSRNPYITLYMEGEISDGFGNTYAINGDSLRIPIQHVAKHGVLQEQDVVIFPNPASDEITIHLNNQHQASEILIYDIQGRLCKNITDLNSNNYHIMLPKRQFKAGLYVAKIITPTGAVSKKFSVLRKL